MMTVKKGISRRTFLAGAAGAAVAPMILPRRVFGANERVVTGHIGCGGMGSAHLRGFNDHVGAICDVDQVHLRRAESGFDRKMPTYTDYRKMLERDDLDAIVAAIPDHWHGIIMVHACQAGKDVYIEKPACKFVAEGRAMVNAAAEYKRVVQVGSQGRSTDGGYQTATYIKNDMIGKVNRVECWHYDNPTGGDPNKFGDPPKELDWDFWVGPSAYKPYNEDYCHFNFRWMLDWGGGQIRDRGAHVLSVVSWALGLDRTGPVKVHATGMRPPEGIWDTPQNFTVTYEFTDPELTIVWAQPGHKAGDHEFGANFIGEKGELVMRGGDGGCFAADEAVNYTPPTDGVHLFRSPGHRENFLECVKTRETPIMDIESGHRVATMCILANMSYRLGRPIEWDAKTERCIGDDQANQMLSTPGRGEYHL